jgi:opacity protein-like surface antigen
MKPIRSATQCVEIVALTFVIVLTIGVSSAYPETYIAGQFGTTISGNKLTNIDLTDFTPNASMSDRSLAPSPLIGIKLGYYFPRARWFGLETEAYHMTPHIKQEATTITIPGVGTATGTLSGDHFRVITWVPVNVMIRYHKTRLQPYVGVGPAVFMGKITTTIPQYAGSESSIRLGLNAKVGAEYFFTRHFTVFAEVKWNYTRFEFESLRATYSPLIGAGGLSYHF